MSLSDENYSPEELTAMLLTHAKEFTKEFGVVSLFFLCQRKPHCAFATS